MHSQQSSRYDSTWTDSAPGRTSRDSSISSTYTDEEEPDQRLKPFWLKYQHLFYDRGLYLDTIINAGKHVLQHPNQSQQYWPISWNTNDRSLYHDPSLPDRLFRGTRKVDKKRFIAKAVHVHSREYEVISTLSCPSLREEPMNHVIPILDLITNTEDGCAFVIMEAWSPHALNTVCCLRQFMSAMRQCIEHIVFMHKQHIAHLDISLQNLVTDCKGRYAYIDYENSRRFCPSTQSHRIENYRATEVPPEFETQTWGDPFKVDIWALGVLILRASKITGLWIPTLMGIVQPMIDEDPAHRPTASAVLQALNILISGLGNQLGPECLSFFD